MATGGGKKAISQRILRITDIAKEPLEFLAPISGYAKTPLVTLEEAIIPLVPILPDVQSFAYAAKQKCKKSADDLTPDESASIMLYTMGWEPPDECLYIVLNDILRSPDRQVKLKPWYLYLRLFLNALFRLPSFSGNVFRGVKLDMSKRYVKGETIVWWGFSSCTTAIEVLQSDLFLGTADARTIFYIHCESAKDICKHSYHPTENEVLLLSATQFAITGCLDQGDLHIIHLAETRPPHPLLQPVPVVVPLSSEQPSTLLPPESVVGTQSSNLSSSVAHLPSYPQATLPKKIVEKPAPSPTTVIKMSKPKYQNAELERLIAKEKTSTNLPLSCKQLTAQDAEIVAFYALYINRTLSTLDLENNQIGGEGAKHLSDALLHNTTLTTLDLRTNQIGAEGAKHLSDALLHNTTLTTLNLFCNRIGAEGAKHLSDALLHNKTLTTLDLRTNQIGAEGAKHLSNALLHNTTLTTLDLRTNQIGAEGAKHLSDTLLHNTTLTTLNLYGNQIGAEGAKHLSDTLLHNTTLTTLDLSRNEIGAEGAKHLVQLKTKNKVIEILCDEDLSLRVDRCVIN